MRVRCGSGEGCNVLLPQRGLCARHAAQIQAAWESAAGNQPAKSRPKSISAKELHEQRRAERDRRDAQNAAALVKRVLAAGTWPVQQKTLGDIAPAGALGRAGAARRR